MPPVSAPPAEVAIIDGGFQGYPGLLGSELPATVTAKNFVDGQSDAQVNGTTVHGTACAEIVHDIAPNAALYLVKVGTDIDLQEAVDWAKTQGVNIISTSLGWYNLTPGMAPAFSPIWCSRLGCRHFLDNRRE